MSELPPDAPITSDLSVSDVLFRSTDDATATYVAGFGDNACLCQDVTGHSEEAGRQAYAAAVEVVKAFQHPNLARVDASVAYEGKEYLLLEPVSGETLESVVTSSKGDLPGRQLLDLSRQLCDALGYVDRQTPAFIFDRLDPARILIRQDGLLKVIDYRLHRCFDAHGGPVLSSELAGRAINYQVLAELICYMALRQTGPADMARLRHLNGKLAAVVERCRSFLDTPGYSFYEVRRSLELAFEVGPEEMHPLWGRVRRVHAAVWLGTLIMLFVGYQLWVLFKAPYADSGQSAFIVNRDRLLTVDTEDVRLKATLTLSKARIVDALLSHNGKQLLLADAGLNEIRVINTGANREEPPQLLSGQPQSLLSGGSLVYAYEPVDHQVAELSLDPVRVRRTFPVEQSGDWSAISPDGHFLYFARSTDVGALDLRSGHTLERGIAVADAGPMAVSPDGRELWVTRPAADALVVVSLDAMKVMWTLEHLGAAQPVGLRFSPDGGTALILCRDSSSVMVVSRHDRKVAAQFATGGVHPVGWGYSSLSPPIMWIIHADSATVSVVDLRSFRAQQFLKLGGSPSVLEVEPRNKGG